jgi:hypothetical protein
MVRTMALYLYALGLVLPPAAVVGGLLMLAIPRRAEARPFSKVARAA